MTKLTFGAHPYLLGFEQLERLVERTAKTASEGYPPFNIEATSDTTYRITLAVAGFREDDLQITVEDRQLVVRGRQAEDVGEVLTWVSKLLPNRLGAMIAYQVSLLP